MIPRSRGRVWVVCGALFILAQAQCTTKQIASDITSQIFKEGAPAFEMEDDVEIESNPA